MNLWRIGMVAALVLSAAAAVFCLFMGECGGVLECGSSTVPMKCHWGYLAAGAVCVVPSILAVVGLFVSSAQARRVVAGAILANMALALLLLFALIGVCANEAMSCFSNRTPAGLLMGAALVAALLGLAKADDTKQNLPKAKL